MSNKQTVSGIFPAGNYYIGDISYVLSSEIYRDFWHEVHNFQDGIYEINNGHFAVSGTKYGDGCYSDNKDNDYPVDAGVIGLVSEKLLVKEELDMIIMWKPVIINSITPVKFEFNNGIFIIEYITEFCCKNKTKILLDPYLCDDLINIVYCYNNINEKIVINTC